jgi:hypothetical protein
VLALVSLAGRFELGIDVVPYAATLVTSGYLPWTTAAHVLLWAAVAAQTGAIAAGRYVPLGPPGGALRTRVRGTEARAQASRR